MSAIGTISGLASGIQWRDMIDQIMEMENSRKLAPINSQATAATKRRDAWKSYSTLLAGVTTAAAGLRNATAFKAYSTSVAKSATTSKELLTVSTSSSAAPGSYDVEVRALAQSEKLRSTTGFGSTADALALAGEFLVNGRAVTLAATDSLASIRDKINAVNSGTNRSGVTASIVTVSATENYLTLTADNSGTRGIELVDSGDGSSPNGVLKDLGILTGAQSANTSGAKTESMRFTSENTALSTMLGLSGPPNVAYISVGGQRVQVDLANDTVQEVLDRIRDAGATADLVKEEVGGKTNYRISTDAVAVDMDPGNDQVASQRIIELMGFVKGTRTSEQAGVNSEIEIDGLTVQRRTNTVSDAVAGVTMDLKVAEIGTKVSVGVSRNLDAIVGSVQAFTAAFNKIIDFQTEQRKPDAALYADASLRASISSLKRSLLTDVPGIDPATTSYTRPAVAGVAFSREGKLEVDSTRLKSALNSNFTEVMALFSTSSSASTTDIRSITGADASASGSHTVNITQAATFASATGTTNFPGVYTGVGADQMTVLDAYTGKSAVISLPFGASIDSVIASLNDQFDSEEMTLTASKSGSRLVIEGSKYGSAASFTVSYEKAGADYAGASHAGLNAGTYAGLDVAGTINGEAATGSGQSLTGATDTAAEGLSFSYTGTALGAIGSIKFGHGIAGELDRIIQGYTKIGEGLIDKYLEGIERSITAIGRRRADTQSRLDSYQERLVKQFTAMESAMSMMNSQSSWLQAQMTSLESMNAK